MINDISWRTWVPIYLQMYAGMKLPGVTHNLNNYVHILDMQFSLINSKMNSSPETPLSEFGSRMQKINDNTNGLMDFMHINSQWSFYTQKELIQTSVPDFLNWLQRFWTNDLYCKHKTHIDLNISESLPNLELPAYALTFCLEQPLANAVEGCQQKDPEGDHHVTLQAVPENNGIRFNLHSPTEICVDSPWEAGTSTKKGHLGLGLFLLEELCRELNWEPTLNRGNGSTEYQLFIPNKRTGAKDV